MRFKYKPVQFNCTTVQLVNILSLFLSNKKISQNLKNRLLQFVVMHIFIYLQPNKYIPYL